MSNEPTKGEGVFGNKKTQRSPWLQFNLYNPLIQIFLFTFFMVGAVLLMTHSLAPSEGGLTRDAIGQPARSDIKATRDFTYVEKDKAATAQKREEAAKSILRIYDHDADMRARHHENIKRAFGEMNELLKRAEQEKQLNAVPPKQPTSGQDEPDPGGEDVVPAEEEVKLTADECVKIAEANRVIFDEALRVIIGDEDFRVLARARFAEPAQEALNRLVGNTLDRHIVPNRRLIEIEGRRGITIRTLRGGVVAQTKRRYDFAEFISANEIPDEVASAAPKYLDTVNADLRAALVNVASQIIKPNTSYNEPETEGAREAARAEVPDLVVQKPFKKGQNIVDRGHIVNAQHLRIFEEMRGEDDSQLSRAQLVVGTVLIALILLMLIYTFGKRYLARFSPTPKDLVLVGGIILAMLLLHQGTIQAFEGFGGDWPPAKQGLVQYAIPVAFGAMLVRLLLTTEIALVYTILLAVFLGVAADQSLPFVVYVIASSTAAAAAVSKVNHRMDLLVAGLATGAVNAITAIAITLTTASTDPNLYMWAAIVAFIGGVLAGMLISAVLPVIEWIFNYTTDIKLLELADLNHPALRELIMRAPGSYHHSVIVGNLCKEAAEAIDANPLLARVGAYYHDLGKGKNPQYFAENQRAGHNPHDKLKPNMSALILKAHVKDGLEIARQHGLPLEIQDFIAQHHGTSLIAYFYHKAKTLEDPSIPEVDEKDYRYPGPKPQTRETAICLLADGIEAASRAMPEPSPDRLTGLVQKMINKAFADGQLDECDLTLKDLNAIARAFIRVLCSMYHSRPQYPSDKKESKDAGSKDAGKRRGTSGGHKRPPKSDRRPIANSDGHTAHRGGNESRASGGKTMFEDRLGEDDPEVRALQTIPPNEAMPAVSPEPHPLIEDSLIAEAEADDDQPAQKRSTDDDADHPDPPGPSGDAVDESDQPDSPDEPPDQPLRRLGLS